MARSQAPDYEQRREAITEKAVELFAAQGFTNASVATLAEACNISKSLIYHYFPSKEDILYEVMVSHIDQMIRYAEDIQSTTASSAEKYCQLIRAFLHLYVKASDSSKVLFKELGNLPKEYRNIIESKQRYIVDLTQALLISFYPELAKNPARARVQTMILFGMINGTYTWYSPKGQVGIDELAEILIDISTGSKKNR